MSSVVDDKLLHGFRSPVWNAPFAEGFRFSATFLFSLMNPYSKPHTASVALHLYLHPHFQDSHQWTSKSIAASVFVVWAWGVGGWLFTICSVLLTWTANPKERRRDNIINDLVVTLSLPAIAAGHVLYKVLHYSGPIAQLLTSKDIQTQQYCASLEAPLNVCEMFSLLSLLLVLVAAGHGQPKRIASIAAIAILCFTAEFALLGISYSVPASKIEAARPFAFLIFGTGIAIIMLVLITTFLSVAHITVRSSVIVESLGTVIMTTVVVGRDPPTSIDARRQWMRVIIGLSATLLPLGVGNMAGNSIAFARHILFASSSRTDTYTSTSFLPMTLLSISDLDQAVALAAGVITLAFSAYETAKKTFGVDGWPLTEGSND